MDERFYSVEEISTILNMHTKTIQRYIREGKLRASKIGKAWRVSGHDLSVFVEGTDKKAPAAMPAAEPITHDNPFDKIMISSVVDIDVSDMDEAGSISNMLTAAMNAKPAEFGKTSLSTQMIESENKLRVMLWGNVKFMKAMMWFFTNYIHER